MGFRERVSGKTLKPLKGEFLKIGFRRGFERRSDSFRSVPKRHYRQYELTDKERWLFAVWDKFGT